MLCEEMVSMTLVADTETIIEFPGGTQAVDIQNQGDGDVWVDWTKPAAAWTGSCIRLSAGMSYEIRSRVPFKTLSLLSWDTPFVQAVRR